MSPGDGSTVPEDSPPPLGDTRVSKSRGCSHTSVPTGPRATALLASPLMRRAACRPPPPLPEKSDWYVLEGVTGLGASSVRQLLDADTTGD
eukprot:323762-Chlamydomonas_euryale.AAC.1